MTDISFKALVLEQARSLATEFVTEFRAEVSRQLQIVETVSTSSVRMPPAEKESASTTSVPENPVKKAWEIPKRVVDSFLKERNTTEGLKGLKLRHRDPDAGKYKLPTLGNDNYSPDTIQRMIDSYEKQLKDPSISADYRALLERTKENLKSFVFGPHTSSEEYYKQIGALSAAQNLERNMHEREAMVKRVYDSDLEEEIQTQAQVLLKMTQALETNEQKGNRFPGLTKILEETQPIDAREKEAKVYSEEDFTSEFIAAQTAKTIRSALNVSDKEKSDYLATREAVGNLLHTPVSAPVEQEILDKAVMNEDLKEILGIPYDGTHSKSA